MSATLLPTVFRPGTCRRWVGLCLLIILTTAISQAQVQMRNGQSTNWQSLPREEAMRALPVELEGTVLCYDPAWGQLYIYDGTNAIYLSPHNFTNQFELGQQVRIKGVTSWAETVPVLTNTSTLVIGHRALPKAPSVNIGDLGGCPGQWVEINGRVLVAEASRERIALTVTDGGQKCLVYVMKTSSTNSFRQLADADVRIAGINASRSNAGKLNSAILFCPGLDQISVVKQGPINRWDLPVTPIDTLLTRPLGDWTNEPVHINGIVSDYQPGESISIRDATGDLQAEVIQVTPLLVDQRVDCWGFLEVRSNSVVLANSYFQSAAKSSTGDRYSSVHKSSSGKVLDSIKEVRSLTKEQASENLPVSVHGTITFVDPEWRVGFMQDERDAIFFDAGETNLQPGQFVEVRGQTDGAGFAPDLINCSTKVLGTNGLPKPLKVELQDTVNGLLDSRWVELEGVVTHVTKENGRISMTLMSPEGKFAASILDLNSNPAPVGLIESFVSIRGACGSVINSRSQLSGIFLHVPGLDQLKVIEPSPSDPFALAAMPISTVATFNSHKLPGRRVKVSGVVTLAMSRREFFLQDSSGGIRVVTSQTNQLRIGEHIDALGFPSLSDFSPCLEEASIKDYGITHLPIPMATTAAEVLRDGRCDGAEIELKAEVVQNYSRNAQSKLVLQDGAIIFTAQMIGPPSESPMREWAVGSILRLRGVCVVQGDGHNEPANFRLLLSGPDAVALVKGAPWLTFERILILLGGTTLASLLAIVWVFSLRQQVRRQTEIIRENQKELMETSRLAGMAEIATSVLHNVGNVLNSVNVSASVISDKLKTSVAHPGFSKVADLMEQNVTNLGDFMTNHPRGKRMPEYIKRLAELQRSESSTVLKELQSLIKNIGHIKDIVARQQSLAKFGGVLEPVAPAELMEDALLINAGNLAQLGIRIKRDYAAQINEINVEKHKLLQILINLINNAKRACRDSNWNDRQITLQIKQDHGKLKMSVRDNGVGIAPENLTLIFRHGFTTRSDGHGFGLHSGALAARQLGGDLTVHSDGLGCGACFTVELPLNHRNSQSVPEAMKMEVGGMISIGRENS